MQTSALSRIGSGLAHVLPIGALLFFSIIAPSAYAAVYKCAAKDGSTTYSDQPCEADAQAIQVTPEPLHSTPNSATQSSAPGNAQLNQAQEQMAALCARGSFDAWYHTQNPAPTLQQKSTKLREALQTCRATLAPPSPIKQSTISAASSPAAMPAQPQSVSMPLTPATIAAAQDKSARETTASLCGVKAFNEWIKAQGHPLPEPNIRIAKMIEISNQCRRPLGLSDMIPPAPIVAPQPIAQVPAISAGTTSAPPTVPPYLYSQQARVAPTTRPMPIFKPAPSRGRLLATSVLIVVTVLAVLAWLARSNFRYRAAMQWILDKFLRLGAASIPILAAPVVLIVGIMANDAGTAAGANSSMLILLIGGLLVLMLLWFSFGYSPRRDKDTGELKMLSAIAMTILYLIGTVGWILNVSWTLQHSL